MTRHVYDIHYESFKDNATNTSDTNQTKMDAWSITFTIIVCTIGIITVLTITILPILMMFGVIHPVQLP